MSSLIALVVSMPRPRPSPSLRHSESEVTKFLQQTLGWTTSQIAQLTQWELGQLEGKFWDTDLKKTDSPSKKSKWREESSTLFWKHFHFMPLTATVKCCHTSSRHNSLCQFFGRIGLPQYVPCHWIQSLNLRQSLDSFNTFSLQGTSALPEWLRRYGNISWHWGRRFHLKDWIEDLLSCCNWVVEKIQISSNLWVSMPP